MPDVDTIVDEARERFSVEFVPCSHEHPVLTASVLEKVDVELFVTVPAVTETAPAVLIPMGVEIVKPLELLKFIILNAGAVVGEPLIEVAAAAVGVEKVIVPPVVKE